MKVARLFVLLSLCGLAVGSAAQAEDPPATEEAPPSQPADAQATEAEPADAGAVDAAAVEADIAAQELSGEAAAGETAWPLKYMKRVCAPPVPPEKWHVAISPRSAAAARFTGAVPAPCSWPVLRAVPAAPSTADSRYHSRCGTSSSRGAWPSPPGTVPRLATRSSRGR